MHKRCEKCGKNAEGSTVGFKMQHWWCYPCYEKHGKYPDYYVKRQQKKFYKLFPILDKL